MGDFEGKGQARELHRWELSPEQPGTLKLVLQYGPGSDQAGDHEERVQLLLPPEAALHLADELNRQARRTLDEQARGRPPMKRARKHRLSDAASKKRPS